MNKNKHDDDEINFVDEKIEKLIESIKARDNFLSKNILNVEMAKTLFSIEFLLRKLCTLMQTEEKSVEIKKNEGKIKNPYF